MPCLTVTGISGLPNDLAMAGNVIYKDMTMRCSMRLPPTLAWEKANEILKEKLTQTSSDSFGAKLEYTLVD